MAFALAPGAAAADYRLAAFETIGSTNDEAMARARAGEPGLLWVVSAHQTQGRGRRGRSWQTPVGNLAASLLMVLDMPAHRMASLGFVAGLALSDALSSVAPDVAVATALDGAAGPGGARLELKWPNDVVAGGAKIAGIMLESEALPTGLSALVVGIGVNVVAAPQGVPYPATSLAALGASVTAEDVFAALSDAWVGRYADWSGTGGLRSIRNAWLSRAAGIGGPVVVSTGARVVRGTFETIDDDGQLVVREAGGGRVTITAGEVHFGAVATLPATG